MQPHDCFALAILVGLLSVALVSAAAWSFRRAEGFHHSDRLKDRTVELERAYHRIDALEQMMDESRAARMNVAAPPPKDQKPDRAELEPDVMAELDMIDDPATRAELEADLRIEIAAHPEQAQLAIVQRMIGG